MLELDASQRGELLLKHPRLLLLGVEEMEDGLLPVAEYLQVGVVSTTCIAACCCSLEQVLICLLAVRLLARRRWAAGASWMPCACAAGTAGAASCNVAYVLTPLPPPPPLFCLCA